MSNFLLKNRKGGVVMAARQQGEWGEVSQLELTRKEEISLMF